MSDPIAAWITGASDQQLRDKASEYEKASTSWNGRDNEAATRLLRMLKVEIAERGISTSCVDTAGVPQHADKNSM